MVLVARGHYEEEDKNKVHLTCVDFYFCPTTIYTYHLYPKFHKLIPKHETRTFKSSD